MKRKFTELYPLANIVIDKDVLSYYTGQNVVQFMYVSFEDLLKTESDLNYVYRYIVHLGRSFLETGLIRVYVDGSIVWNRRHPLYEEWKRMRNQVEKNVRFMWENGYPFRTYQMTH